MTDKPISSMPRELRWTKLMLATLGSAFVSAVAVASVVWGAIEIRGNDVWAPKVETAKAIVRLTKLEASTYAHTSNTDLHMSESAKRAAFYSKERGMVLESTMMQFQNDQREFWKEQRGVNREILSRLK